MLQRFVVLFQSSQGNRFQKHCPRILVGRSFQLFDRGLQFKIAFDHVDVCQLPVLIKERVVLVVPNRHLRYDFFQFTHLTHVPLDCQLTCFVERF